jgi:hypothetical protein
VILKKTATFGSPFFLEPAKDRGLHQRLQGSVQAQAAIFAVRLYAN